MNTSFSDVFKNKFQLSNGTLNAGAASSWGGYKLGEAALINFGSAWTYDGFTTSRAQALRLGVRYDGGSWSTKAAVFDTRVNDTTLSCLQVVNVAA